MPRADVTDLYRIDELLSGEVKAARNSMARLLNGSKMWITNGSLADLAIVWAKTGPGAESIRGFIAEKGMPGFSASDIHGKSSLRASPTSELAFQDVRGPERNVLPNVTELRGPLACLNKARTSSAFAVTSAAIARFEGANGISDAYPPIRHMLNLESVLTYEGTHEVHTLGLGKAMSGIDAFA